MEKENEKVPVLLAVLAHPDDETFGMGGTLALYAKRGAKVHLVCATRGESGDVDPKYLEDYTSIADRRVAELKCAAGILGLTEVHFMDYRDSGMKGSENNHHPKALTAAPVEEVARKVAGYIREIRPQVVLTFDPIGGYRHPDHIAIHNATVRGFELARDQEFEDGLEPFKPDKLYFHFIPRGLFRFAVKVLPLFGRDPRRYGRNQDIDLVALVEEADFPTDAEINYQEVRAKKEEAVACHSSQLDESMSSRGLIYWIMRWYERRDYYMRAYPEPDSGNREKDLFSGIDVDW